MDEILQPQGRQSPAGITPLMGRKKYSTISKFFKTHREKSRSQEAPCAPISFSWGSHGFWLHYSKHQCKGPEGPKGKWILDPGPSSAGKREGQGVSTQKLELPGNQVPTMNVPPPGKNLTPQGRKTSILHPQAQSNPHGRPQQAPESIGLNLALKLLPSHSNTGIHSLKLESRMFKLCFHKRLSFSREL